MPPGELTGRCLCGAVRYTVVGKPVTAAVCHCDDCQRQSGSAFSVFVGVKEPDFRIEGETRSYVTVGADTRKHRDRRFCPVCDSPITSTLEEMPGLVFVKAGTLDDRSGVRPGVEVWRSSAQRWVRRPTPRLRLRRGLGQRITRLMARRAR